MAEIKQLLKAARKFIDEENFSEALRLCNQIHLNDQRNYMCWVFVGKSLELSKDATFAFQIAISIDPKNPLAWKGLAKYFEKIENTKAKLNLFNIYDQLIPLDIPKAGEVIFKLSRLGSVMKSRNSLKILLKYLDLKPGPEISDPCIQELPKLLMADIVYEQKHVVKAINYVVSRIFKEPARLLYPILTESMLRNNIDIPALNGTISIVKLNGFISFRLWLCKWLCGYFVVKEKFPGVNVERYKEDLTRGFKFCRCSILLSAMISYSKGFYRVASVQVTPLAFSQAVPCVEGIFMMKCNVKLGRWIVVERTASEFGVGSDDQMYLYALEKYKLVALAEQKKWNQAVRVGRSLPARLLNIEEKALLAKCCIESNEDEAEDLKEILRPTVHYQHLEALSLIVQQEYRRAIFLLKKMAPDHVSLYYIGRCYWELKEYDNCEKYFMRSLRYGSTISDVPFHLGMINHFQKNDECTALVYYEQAFDLNSSDNTLVKYMSDIYLKLDLKCKHLSLLSTHRTFFPDETWLHYRLGHLYMAFQDWDSACDEFRQHVIVNPEDVIGYICLAEAYYGNKAYMHAVITHRQAMMMDESQKTFCLTRLGYIYYSMNDLMTAIRLFKEVFERDPNYVIAFKGAAEAWIQSSRVISEIRHYHVARDGLQVAVDYLLKGLNLTNTIFIFWKLLGNAFSALISLPTGYDYVEVCLDNPDDILNIGTVYLKSSLTKLTEYCYWRAYCEPTDYMRKQRAQDLTREILREELFANARRLAMPMARRTSYAEFLSHLRRGTSQNNNP